MKAKAVVRAAIAAFLAVLLAGCGGPSADDVRQALRGNDQMVMMMGLAVNGGFRDRFSGSDRPDVDVSQLMQRMSVEVGQCVAATNASGQICDVRIGFDPCGGIEQDEDMPQDEVGMDGEGGASSPQSFSSRTCGFTKGEWFKGRYFEAGGEWQFEPMR